MRHFLPSSLRYQPYDPIATAPLEYIVARSVYLVEVDEDRYEINASMVCAWYAWWYERLAPESQMLKDCQIEVRQASQGS